MVAESVLLGAATGPLTPAGPAGEGDEVARLFEALTVQRAADGGIRIEAPPHAARALVSLLDGMARLLGRVSGDRDQPSNPPEDHSRHSSVERVGRQMPKQTNLRRRPRELARA